MKYKFYIFSSILFMGHSLAFAGSVDNTEVGTPTWHEYTDEETLSAETLNNHFDQLGNAVNDNDNRITTNEAAIVTNQNNINSLGTSISTIESRLDNIGGSGRIFVPIAGVADNAVKSINGVTVDLPHSIRSSVIGQNFGKPPGYISGDVNVTVVFSGCSNTTIAHNSNSPKLSKLNIGPINSGSDCSGDACPTSTFDIGTGNTIYAITANAGELLDFNTPLFTRRGNVVEDNCANDITIFGFFVDYPVGQ